MVQSERLREMLAEGIAMRLMLDTLVALMLVGLLGGMMWQRDVAQTMSRDRETARAELKRFQQQIALQSALATVQRNERGYPATVDPEWFMGNLPANPLLDDSHPWVEIAGPLEKDLQHPLQRVAVTSAVAKFWYNPANGCVRARVPAALSDAAAVELYNFVNDCALSDLFAGDNDH